MFPSHWQGTGPSFRHSEFPVSLVPPSFISELSGPLPAVDTKLHVLCCARKHFWRVKSSRIHFQGCCWLTSQHGHPLTQNKLVPGTETHVLGMAENRQTKGTRQWWFWISTLTFEIVCTFRMWDPQQNEASSTFTVKNEQRWPQRKHQMFTGHSSLQTSGLSLAMQKTPNLIRITIFRYTHTLVAKNSGQHSLAQWLEVQPCLWFPFLLEDTLFWRFCVCVDPHLCM